MVTDSTHNPHWPHLQEVKVIQFHLCWQREGQLYWHHTRAHRGWDRWLISSAILTEQGLSVAGIGAQGPATSL